MYRFYSDHKKPNRIAVVGEYKDGVLQVAAAKCSAKDHFVRKKGRMIAEERLRKGKLFMEYKMPVISTDLWIETALNAINVIEQGADPVTDFSKFGNY